MRRTIPLDGEWERRDFLDEAWRWSDALRCSDLSGWNVTERVLAP